VQRNSKCSLCAAPPGVSMSCHPGKRGMRIPFGSEFHINAVDPATGAPATRCPVCGTPVGGYHHVDCMVDECPACQGAAWRCGCIGGRLRMLRASQREPVSVEP
jgi:hypothetical protein